VSAFPHKPQVIVIDLGIPDRLKMQMLWLRALARFAPLDKIELGQTLLPTIVKLGLQNTDSAAV
jgi:hypothetical protein